MLLSHLTYNNLFKFLIYSNSHSLQNVILGTNYKLHTVRAKMQWAHFRMIGVWVKKSGYLQCLLKIWLINCRHSHSITQEEHYFMSIPACHQWLEERHCSMWTKFDRRPLHSSFQTDHFIPGSQAQCLPCTLGTANISIIKHGHPSIIREK